MNREVHVRFWERPGVKFPRATRHARAMAAPEIKPLVPVAIREAVDMLELQRCHS